MSIRAYSSIVENISSSNYFDIYDENLSKIRFTLRDQQLYITSYNSVTNTWFPATVNFDNAPAQSTSIIDYQDILSSNNIRIQLNAELPINGKELLIFENDNNYNIIKSSGLNYAINSSQYLPTTNLDNRLVVYELDSNGKPRLTLSSVSSNNFASTFVTLANNQTINSAKTFGLNSLLLGGNGGNITLNGSQTVSSSSYSLEYPTASPSGVLNVLTTSGSSPFSKLTWTELSSYALLSNFDQLTALKTIGSPTFANLTINTGGALNLNYISTPASSDILATLNTNKQLTNSGVSLATLCTLGNTQTFTADKTFNYSSGKIKLSNYSTDNTSTNNILMLNSSGYIVPCNKLYSDITSSQTISGDIVDIASSQTITGNKTLSGSTTMSGTVTLSGVNADTATSSGQKLAVLNTTTNAIERVNITPDTLVNSNTAQTITGIKSFNSDCMKVNNIFALGTSLTVKNSGATSFDIIFNSKFTNTEPGWLTIDPNNTSAASSGIAFYGNLCIQENTEIMKILALTGTNTDTSISSGQKLTVLNTSTHAIERVNITANNVATLSGTQTFSGDKTFTGTVNLGTVNTSGRVSASYTLNTTTSFQTIATLNSTGMYLMTASTNAADGTHGLYYICMEEGSMIVALSANNFAFQFVSGTTLQVRTVSQGFNNCEINILRLK